MLKAEDFKESLKAIEESPILITKIENPTEEMMLAAMINGSDYVHTLEDPTDKVLIEAFKRCSRNIASAKRPLPEISEEVAMETIENFKKCNFFRQTSFLQDVFLKSVKLTKSIIKSLIEVNYGYVTCEEIKKCLDDELKRYTTQIFLNIVTKLKGKHNMGFFVLPDYIPLSEDDYKYLLDNDLLLTASHLISKRKDMPLYIKKYFIKESRYNIDIIFLDDNILEYYFDLYFDELLEYQEIPYEIIRDNDLVSLLERKGEVIALIKKPNAKQRAAAIKCNPENVKYIKNLSEKDCIHALHADKNVLKYISKRTKKICEAAEIPFLKEEANPYPEEFYYVSMKEDLADEGYLVRNLIVEGKKMEKFLSEYTSISFGNLDDDNERLIKDIASFKPITREEIEILKKFGVDDVESGYWHGID